MDTLMRHVQDSPQPASMRTEQDVPTELDDLVLQCLAKSPSERTPTVDRLADRLQSIAWRETWTDDRAMQWWDRHLPEPLEKD
jgi:hypothetical protein